MRGSNVPAWFVNQTVDSLANLTNNSMYKKDGRTAFAEGEWTTFGTSDQMWHARQVVGNMFPAIAWQELEYWARTQRSDGQIHHDFNYMADTSQKDRLVDWDDTEHADYRSVDKWVDLNAGFIVSVYETYQQTGDADRLEYFWPYMKKAGQRIFDQVDEYGSADYPYTFDDSENSYDAGGDPNAFNASLSAVAYEVMARLADKRDDAELAARYDSAFDQVKESYRQRYLNGNFPTGRISESYFAGQWLSLSMRLGEIWTADETDQVLSDLDGYYHPLYWGLGYTRGTYDEWTPYLLAHYGGLLLNTRRADQFVAMQKDSYDRQFGDRDNVFNMPLDILPEVDEPDYAATAISGDKQYISTPTIWRNYNDVIGYKRDQSSGDLWVQPQLLPEMDHTLTDGTFVSPQGYGTISYRESGDTFQNQQITVTSDEPMRVSDLHLHDYLGAKKSITVTVDGRPVSFTRHGSGYAKELVVRYDGQIGPEGVRITVTGDPGAPLPATPDEPDGTDVPPGPAHKNPYTGIDAEDFDATGGVQTATSDGTSYVTETDDQDYVRYDSVGFGDGAQALDLRVRTTKASHLELALGSVSGNAIAEIPVPDTGGAWDTVRFTLPEPVGDTQNLVLRFRSNDGDSSDLMDLDRITFLPVGFDSMLDRTAWTATASRNSAAAGAAFDNDGTTRWNSSYQTGSEWYLLDLGSVQTFDRIVLDDSTKSPEDYPRGYAVSVSTDGTTFGEPVATGTGSSGETVIELPPQEARYIRISQTGAEPTKYWSIEELYVYDDAS
ncbi:discoidin domain-containing protein [Isoptericola sp. NPDC019482]|uniref:discoidin domain-containing protein n=1 Tax=Isoptericola sp. NPDC019482 TaxID=3154688 RepID=UPI00347A78FB